VTPTTGSSPTTDSVQVSAVPTTSVPDTHAPERLTPIVHAVAAVAFTPRRRRSASRPRRRSCASTRAADTVRAQLERTHVRGGLRVSTDARPGADPYRLG
jgi:hypothetical protein